MLPIRSLDTERFSDISQSAREMITKLYTQWTDFNYHDPGITFIELFAWMKEMQQYHMDQIGGLSLLKFLKILNTDQRPKRPARADVRVYDVCEDQILPQGTRMLAGGILFETVRPEAVTASKIMDCYSMCGGQRIDFGAQLAVESGKIQCAPFGRDPQVGDNFCVGFERPLQGGIPFSIYFDVFDGYPVKRNPVSPDQPFAPLAALRWEYRSAAGWRDLQVLRDDTHQCLFSGRITFFIDGEMAKGERGGYWLRATLLENSYDVAPILCGIAPNMIEVAQRETMSVYADFEPRGDDDLQVLPFNHGIVCEGGMEAYGLYGGAWHRLDIPRFHADGNGTLFHVNAPKRYRGRDGALRLVCCDDVFSPHRISGEGDGFPGQRCDLERSDILADGFAIMVADGPGGSYTDWSQVPDFDASCRNDRHYVFDEETGSLLFGDCEHGMAPRGEIVVIACASSLGRDGNVKSGKISRLVREDIKARVANPDNARGGLDRESIDEAFMRARGELKRVERAITYEDYEHLVMETPGLMIRGCRAIPVTQAPRFDGSLDEGGVTVVVQPYAGGKIRKPSAACIANIRTQLSERRLLGTRVSVVPPEYIGIEIFAEIAVKPYYPDAKERVAGAVEEYFASSAWEFGRPVLHGTIYGIIDTLDCVGAIHSLSIDAQGKGITRSAGGDVLLPQNGMAYLKNAVYMATAVE